MSVYFMHPIRGGLVKIGHSLDVEARRYSLEREYGNPLTILKVLPGGREEEKAMHERFGHLRIKTSKYGPQPELFQPALELMSFLGVPESSSYIVWIEDAFSWISLSSLGKHEAILRSIASRRDISVTEYAREIWFRAANDNMNARICQQIDKDYAEFNGSIRPVSVPEPVCQVDIGEEWAWI